MKAPPKNVAASVRARLAQLAARQGYDFQQVLTTYAIERLLFRLSISSHTRDFVLKGATLFTLWEGFPHRQTRDLDLLGYGENNVEHLVTVFAQVCTQPVEPDGLVFGQVSGERIRAVEEYGGVRLHLSATLEKAVVPFGVDIGFGDAISPPPREVDFPTLLDFPKPRLRAYPAETVVAEKFEAMVRLGMANSRMKDFFDLWHLGKTQNFDGQKLAKAIQSTFARRQTQFPQNLPIGLSAEFATNPGKQKQWQAFCRKDSRLPTMGSLSEVIQFLVVFIGPPFFALAGGKDFSSHWVAGGPWQIV